MNHGTTIMWGMVREQTHVQKLVPDCPQVSNNKHCNSIELWGYV